MVIDASVWISYILPFDTNHTITTGWVDRFIGAGGQLEAPTLFIVEVGGAIARRNADPMRGHQAINQLTALPGLQLFNHNQPDAERAARLAASLQIRGADALYVEVAQRIGQPLITWDIEQFNRAQTVIQVYTPATAP